MKGDQRSSATAEGRTEWAIFRCPACRAPLEGERCGRCGAEIEAVDGVRVLVRDPEALREMIDEARASNRGGWYEGSHTSQFTGPYRHHVAKRRRYLDDLLGRLGPPRREGAAAVDLGCGDGAHLDWLGRYAETVYGSDYSLLRLLRAAAVIPPERVFVADATDYPAVDEAFDIVFMNHVLEHIPDYRTALAEVRRILAPDGIAVIGVPNEGAAWWRLAYRLQPEMLDSTDHVNFFTADTLAAAGREANLRVREVKALGWGLPHWSLDARVRGRKWVDDLFEAVGSRAIPSQASSLYLTFGR